MADYRFNDAANAIYHFLWGEFCDWYLEFTKPILGSDDAAAVKETRAATAWVLNQVLHLLHPFMPFLTEELWQQTGGQAASRARLLMLADWPSYDQALVDAAAIAEIGWVIRVVSEIRALRTEMNIAPGAQIPAELHDAGETTRRRLDAYRDLVVRLARLARIEIVDGPVAKGAAQIVVDEATVALPLAGVIDIAQERARLTKELDKAKAEAAKIEKKLGNEQFVAKAPPEVVEEQRQRLAEAAQASDKLAKALERLAGL
jgi:valyl-tRNA synthetase